MRTLLIPVTLVAVLPLCGAHAQPAPSSADAAARTGQPIEGAAPGPDGTIYQWGPPQPIVEAAPPPAADYPPCTNGRTDSCVNPDPARELPYYPVEKVLAGSEDPG